MRHWASALILTLLLAGAPLVADDAQPTRAISTCTVGEVKGKSVSTGKLHYVVPKHTKLKRVRDIDYNEYRVFLTNGQRWEVLSLFSGNGSPFSTCSAAPHQRLKLPDGTEGTDARCTKADSKESRSTGFESEYAYYDSVSPESAKYFDAIIDSMCYEPFKK